MDPFEQYLQSDEHRRIDADELRTLGRKAAVLFVEKQKPLTDTVRELSKEAGLNAEQTRRVVEFANNTTFSMIFKAGFSQNITFPLADADAACRKVEEPVGQSKHASVRPQGGRYVPGQEGVSLEDAFEAGLHKIASADEPDRPAQLMQWRDKVAEAKELRRTADAVADEFLLKVAELDTILRDAVSEGHPSYVLGACIAAGSPAAGLTNFLSTRYGDLVDMAGMAKVAEEQSAVVPNPITETVQKLEELQQQLMSTQQLLDQATQLVAQMVQTMQAPSEENPADTLFQATAPPPQATQPAPQPPQPQQPASNDTAPSAAM